jgi:hypothetical protein
MARLALIYHLTKVARVTSSDRLRAGCVRIADRAQADKCAWAEEVPLPPLNRVGIMVGPPRGPELAEPASSRRKRYGGEARARGIVCIDSTCCWGAPLVCHDAMLPGSSDSSIMWQADLAAQKQLP